MAMTSGGSATPPALRVPSYSALSTDAAVIGLLTLVTAVGLAFRLPLMGDSLFGDELSTFFVVDHDFRGMLAQVAGPQEWTPPLYFAIAWIFSKLGPDPWLLRLPSLLAGVATIPLVFVFGSKTVGKRAGMVAAALVALSPLMIFYSTEARGYALLAFLVLCSTILLLTALERGNAWWWALYGALLAAAMYTHYTAIFILAGQTIWALVTYPRSRKAIVLSVLLAVVLWSPWLEQYIADATNPYVDVIGSTEPLSPHVFFRDLLHFASSDGVSPGLAVPGVAALVLIGLGVGIGVSSLFLRREFRPGQQILLLLVLVAAPVFAEGLVSVFGPRVFSPRILMPSYPGLAILVGALVVSRPRRIGILGAVLLIAGMFIGALSVNRETNRRPDFTGVVDFVDRFGEPGDPIVYVPWAGPGAWQSLEVELGPGSARFRDQFVFRVGAPTLEQALHIRKPSGPGQYPGLLPVDSGRVANQVFREASQGRIFLVTPSPLDLEEMADGAPSPVDLEELANASVPAASIEDFLIALPSSWREERSLTTYGWLAPTVYELRLTKRRSGAR